MKRTLSYLITLSLIEGTSTVARAEDSNPVSAVTITQANDQQLLLSGLWVFATLNYLYCDVVALMDAKMLAQYGTGTVNGFQMTEGFLTASTLLMQIPMSMVVLSRLLNPKASRIANIVAGSLMTLVQGATLFGTKPAAYYLASSIIEIATTAFITVYSIFFFKVPEVVPTVSASKDSMNVGVRFTF